MKRHIEIFPKNSLFDKFGQPRLRDQSQKGELSEREKLHKKLLFDTLLHKIKPKTPESYELTCRDVSIALALSFFFLKNKIPFLGSKLETLYYKTPYKKDGDSGFVGRII